MATIKSYTDIEQSKKLAEILLLESADMLYIMYRDGEKPQNGDENLSTTYESNEHKWYWINIIDEAWNMRIEKDIPCWSLAALLDVLPKNLNIGRPSLESNYKGYCWIQYYDEFMKPNNYKTECFNNSVDACYEMILKLHEFKLL